ncbi:ribbon-helix-helix protein, CopG family [Candidatus Pacearchaeota archaeon]|nr:ribbon-helix-helix protein, CopG family [Candidatus Pacearchaeota archaeon]
MKERISATVDKEIVKTINSLIENKKYRNKSHVIEIAIENLAREENDKNKK